jgi:Ras-related protein Rab-28
VGRQRSFFGCFIIHKVAMASSSSSSSATAAVATATGAGAARGGTGTTPTDNFSMCILGDGSTGKSTIIHMFRTEGFERVYKQTIGCDFYEKSLAIRSRDVSLKVWDIGGQSIHSKNIAAYVGSSHAVFLVYDVTNPESFNNLEDWLRVVRQHATASHVYLVGNKIDLLSLRQVTAAQHDKFIAEHGLQGGVFMSAKSGENVIRTFYQVAGDVVGLRLTAHELAFHDKVCVCCRVPNWCPFISTHQRQPKQKQVIAATVERDKDEGRTAFADEIEREDREAEERKKRKKKMRCTVS